MLEDAFEDIVAKARYGKGWSLCKLARRSKLRETRIAALEDGAIPERTETMQLASALGLDAKKLEVIARGAWEPTQKSPYLLSRRRGQSIDMIHIIEGELWNAPVYAYLLIDWAEMEAVLFDTADRAQQIISFVQQEGICLLAVCITHADNDHIGGLEHIHQETGTPPVYLHPNERSVWMEKTENPFLEGGKIKVGHFQIKALETPGHTAGGISYLIESGLEMTRSLVFVGDALFAGSLGRARSSYPLLLQSVRKNILSLPKETLLFPGHGPVTSVQEELAHNPFFI